MLREVDTRTIPGTTTEVRWIYCTNTRLHTVTLHTGSEVQVYLGSDGRAATDAFYHTLAMREATRYALEVA